MRDPSASTPLPACFGGAREYTLNASSRWKEANLSTISWSNGCGTCPILTNSSSDYGTYWDYKNKSTCGRSQEGQDILVALLLAGVNEEAVRDARVPTFLEMGGGDGVGISNTFLLEACFGWRGLLVEALPSLARTLCRNRPRALSFSFAVCDARQGTVNFSVPLSWKKGPKPEGSVPCSRLARIVPGCTTASGYFEEKWVTAGALETKTRLTNRHTVQMRIPCANLSAMLATAGVTHLDFWSLDVEGAETVAMRTIDWDRMTAYLIQVEQSGAALEKNQEVRDILWKRGFVHVATRWVWQGAGGDLADEYFLNGTYLRHHLARVAEVVPDLSKETRAQLLAIANASLNLSAADSIWARARRILEQSARRLRLFRQPNVYYTGPF